jgi:hypothetical protein
MKEKTRNVKGKKKYLRINIFVNRIRHIAIEIEKIEGKDVENRKRKVHKEERRKKARQLTIGFYLFFIHSLFCSEDDLLIRISKV